MSMSMNKKKTLRHMWHPLGEMNKSAYSDLRTAGDDLSRLLKVQKFQVEKWF